MAGSWLPEHIGPMAASQFRYFFNEQTLRWDVVWKHLDGAESVIGTYATEVEAIEHVSRANSQPPPSSP